uniref:Ure2p7 n=1 Tax=Exophiala pisciphila TaxID=86051 RepID=A0A077CZX5_9EURO|nr:Ure2p7 [Exophiala pisciphila]
MSNENVKSLLLHAHDAGPNPFKIAMALEFLKVPYHVKMWEFGDDPQKGVNSATFLKINENGRVPALEDPNTGVVSWESGAIMNYVRRVYDKAGKLGPKSSNEQDIVDLEKWEQFLLTTLGPMTGQVSWFKNYNALKNEDALNRYCEQTFRCYRVFEEQLRKSGGETVLGGSRVTSVDLHFQAWVKKHEVVGLSLENYPLIDKWLARISALPEVKAAYKKLGDAPKAGE